MNEQLFYADKLRNAALSMAEQYDLKSTSTPSFNVQPMTKAAADSMPLFSKEVAEKLADKQIEISKAITLSSINGKIKAQDKLKVDAEIKFAKGKKKDSYYGIESP